MNLKDKREKRGKKREKRSSVTHYCINDNTHCHLDASTLPTLSWNLSFECQKIKHAFPEDRECLPSISVACTLYTPTKFDC